MLSACLLRVRAADDICAYDEVSMELVIIFSRRSVRRIPYSIACWAWKLCTVSAIPTGKSYSLYSRSLPSSEALEEHLCIAVDAEVLDGFGVRGRACRIALLRRGFSERGAQGSSNGLHRDNEAVTKADVIERNGVTGVCLWMVERRGGATYRSQDPPPI